MLDIGVVHRSRDDTGHGIGWVLRAQTGEGAVLRFFGLQTVKNDNASKFVNPAHNWGCAKQLNFG